MSVLGRWKSKLSNRRTLLKRAQASLAWWTARAVSPRRTHMIADARARIALRKRQISEAERVVARHSEVSSMSNAGVAFVAGFEGFRARPYRDPVGVWTIGYGETLGITSSTGPWTRHYAAKRLRARLNADYLRPVLQLADRVNLTLSQREADALGSLVYNLGPGILDGGRTMGDAIRSKNRGRIAAAFLVYDKAGGRRLAGLTRRRKAERAMFRRG